EPAIRDAVAGLARDGSPDVQLQVAISARKIDGLDPLPILVDVLSACGEDRLIPAIVWQNLHQLLPGQGARFVELIGPPDVAAAPAVARLLPHAVDRIAGEPGADLGPVGGIVGRLVGRDNPVARQCLAAISDRLGEMSEGRRAVLRDLLGTVLRPTLTG